MTTVRQLASELKMSSRDVLERARMLGSDVSGDSSVVDPATTERLRAERRGARDGARDPWSGARSPGRMAESSSESMTSVLERPSRSGTRVPSPAGDGGHGPPPPPGSPRSPTPPGGGAGRVVSQLTELPLLILLAFVIAVIIKTFLVQAFFIPSGSMFPTLHVGDRVLVEKLSYRFGQPERGDVVVFAKSVFGRSTPDLPWYLDARNFLRELLGLPTGSEQDYIKRIVAVGGDTVRYSGTPRRLIVNGEVAREPYTRARRDRFSPSLVASDCRRLRMQTVAGGCRVPEGKVFVMGDNRSNSEDSRAIGPVKETKIVGHAFVIIWPPGDVGTV
jgi:signal peptidase I